MQNHLYGVILAGGSGTRFWPLSKKSRPKQFLSLFGDETLIQTTLRRLSPLIPDERWIVVTNETHLDTVRRQLPQVPESGLIGEPIARNTAPCIAAATALIHARDPQAVVVVLPSDHYIADPERFRDTIRNAAGIAASSGALVTLGITPTHPETGYGYIQFAKGDDGGAAHGPAAHGAPTHGAAAHRVTDFKEKPDLKTAMGFLAEGRYLWNSGMFIWKASSLVDALAKHAPDIHGRLDPFLRGKPSPAEIAGYFHGCPSISIDYGLMEKAEDVLVLPGDFGWNDVGSWLAVHELGEKDASGNTGTLRDTLLIDADGNHIHAAGDRLVTLVGVSGLAVVETEDVLMICPLEKAQDVKKAVEALAADERLKRYA